MATPAQITANRLNAQKSTGPRTPEGKSAARLNALKHGLDAESILLPGEDVEAYNSMVDNYYAQFNPRSPLEEAHVATIIHADWIRRRLRRIQGKLYRDIAAENGGNELDIFFTPDSPKTKLLRRVTAELASLERSYFRALNDLRLIHRANQPQLLMPPPHLIDEKLASFREAADSRESRPQPAPQRPNSRDDNPALRL